MAHSSREPSRRHRFKPDGERASMKSFQPKAEAAPPGAADGSDDPPSPPPSSDTAAPEPTHPEPTHPEPEPMPHPNSRNRNAEVDFRGQKRSNATHASVTDPEARLYKKSPGTGAMLCFMGGGGSAGLPVDGPPDDDADGKPQRAGRTDRGHAGRRPRRAEGGIGDGQPARAGIDPTPHPRRRVASGCATGSSPVGDGYDSADIIAELRQICVTPHVARKARHCAIDGRTTRHPGYAVSQKRRKKIEEPFGWAKTVGQMAQTMLRGTGKLGAQFTLTMAACNLARLPKLLAA